MMFNKALTSNLIHQNNNIYIILTASKWHVWPALFNTYLRKRWNKKI